MLTLTLSLAIACSLVRCAPTNYLHPHSQVHHHTQRTDHFSYLQRNETFTQRVIIHDGEWRRNGDPIFFYAGNEDDIFMFANYTGFLWQQASNFSAMVVFAEHRYYGQSMPFGNQSLSSVDKYAYLSVSQAMADFANNIVTIKSDYNASDSPVIVFGGSYGGMLAVYMRHKYRNLVAGAVASSAPILTHTDGYNCSDFNRIVTSDFAQYGESCVGAVKQSWSALRRIAATRSGVSWIKSTFHLCPRDVSSHLDIDYFISWIAVIYSVLAMTDYPVVSGFLKEKPAHPIGAFCREMPHDADNLSDRQLITAIYAGLSASYLNSTGQTQCNALDSDDGGIVWSVQSCTEILTPICTSDGDMFEATSSQGSFNSTEFVEQCSYYYNVTPNYNYINTELIGDNIDSLSNVIFSNGLRDPWSSGGVLSSDNPQVDVIIIEDACHHEDLRGSHANDSQATVRARALEVDIIRRWIAEHGREQDKKHPCGGNGDANKSSTTASPHEDGSVEKHEQQEKDDNDFIVQDVTEGRSRLRDPVQMGSRTFRIIDVIE